MRLFILLPLVISGFFVLGQSKPSVLGTDIGLTFKESYLSRYLFRGRTFSLDDTYQGEFGIGIASWSYNLVYTEPAKKNQLIEQEFNHTISFTSVSGHSISTIGYQLFDYDGDGIDTQELFVRYSRATRWQPSYGIAYDIDTYKGYYLDFSLSRSIPFTRRSKFIFSGQLAAAFDLKEEVNRSGFVTEQGVYSKDGLVHASLHVNYLFQFSRRFNLEAGYGYHRANDDILYNDVTIKREQSVAHLTIKMIIP